MATLTLEVRTSADAAGSVDLVAEIVPVGRRGERVSRTVAVGTGGAREIRGLAAGPWEVRLLTPAGRMISREVDVGDDGPDQVVRLRLDGPADGRPVRRKPGSGRQSSLFPGGYFTKSFSSPSIRSLGVPLGGGFTDPAPTRVLVLRGPVPDGSSDDAILSGWERLARCVEGDIDPAIALDASPIPSGPSSVPGVHALASFPSGDEGRRVFAVASGAGRRRLHAVPVPFRIHGPSGDVVLNRDGASEGRLATRVTLRDPRYAGLVGYLASGDLAAASALLGHADVDRADQPLHELAVGILRGKAASPLGASAAAYVLLGSDFASGPREVWHDWIGNLRRNFPWVPDGSILAARLTLLRAASAEDARAALEPLREAVRRGLPFYSVGLGWLIRSMRHFPEDRLLAQAAPLLERVSIGLDMDEAFTTLDLGEDA